MMLRRFLTLLALASLALSSSLGAQDKPPEKAPPKASSPAHDSAEEMAAIARGGRLYDDWIKELGISALRIAEHSTSKLKGRPERCVDCHGWDYNGKDGPVASHGLLPPVKGIQSAAALPAARIKTILGDVNHGYGDFLGPADYDDLVAFITKGQVAMTAMIEQNTGRSRGDASAGNPFFQTICANCHGNDGQQIVDSEPLGDMARANPWRAIHTLLNGHPNGNMPALRVLNRSVVLDLLAYAQTLPVRDAAASIVRGARLYDTWYKENKHDVPPGAHPSYPVALSKTMEPRTTWRCKECHGWDYRGVTLHEGGKDVTIKGIRGLSGGAPYQVIALLGNSTHRYGNLLTLRDMTDLAMFVTRGQADMDEFIDRQTGKAKGDGMKYVAHYQTICATCHGHNGREIRTMPPLGRIANNDPYRALHGIFNGHPGEAMPALLAFSRDLSVGILAYIQTLPAQR